MHAALHLAQLATGLFILLAARLDVDEELDPFRIQPEAYFA